MVGMIVQNTDLDFSFLLLIISVQLLLLPCLGCCRNTVWKGLMQRSAILDWWKIKGKPISPITNQELPSAQLFRNNTAASLSKQLGRNADN